MPTPAENNDEARVADSTDTAAMDRRFQYVIDAEDTIVSVNDDWMAFSRENAASHLRRDTVVGKGLLDFVTGRETRHLYRMMIDRVRRDRKPLVVPFRCDGPTVRRFMELAIAPGADGQVIFTGRILRQEHRQSVPLLEVDRECIDESLAVCSWCKRVAVAENWLEVENAAWRLNLFYRTALPKISHVLCGDCSIRIGETLPPES